MKRILPSRIKLGIIFGSLLLNDQVAISQALSAQGVYVPNIHLDGRKAARHGPSSRHTCHVVEVSWSIMCQFVPHCSHRADFSEPDSAHSRPGYECTGETLNNDSLSGILQGFLELMRIKVQTHISVGNTADFCQDVKRVGDEFGISTVVFPWEASSTSISTQFTRAEALLTSTETQVKGFVKTLRVWIG